MNTTSAPVRYLSAREAAAYCGVSERTVRRWLKRGQLQADKRGNEFRIPIAALEPFKVTVGDLDAAAPNGHAAGRGTASTVLLGLPADTPRQGVQNGDIGVTVSEAPHLAALVRDLQAQLLAVTAAATLYQERTRVLEAALAQARAALGAGAATAPQDGKKSAPSPNSYQADTSLARPWWRQLVWWR
jgi:excisionase family DNA binding protein